MMKIYCRFRFFDINYGAYLGTYFEFSAKKFDPPTSKPLDEIVRHSDKYYGNLLWKKVALDIFEVNPIRITFYGVSWLIKMLAYTAIHIMKKRTTVVKSLAYFVSISQKVHMTALNSVAIDLIPYTLISLLHTRDLAPSVVWFSGLFLGLLVFDFCEIWCKGGQAKISEFKEESNLDISSFIELREQEKKKIVTQKDLNPNRVLDQ